jgi:NAD(P)H-dependent FMN reductase
VRRGRGISDGVPIVSHEYAHCTSGVLKNALEWLGRRGRDRSQASNPGQRVHGHHGGDNTRAWLSQTLTVMGPWFS